MHSPDLAACCLTPPGRGAVAVIALRGDLAKVEEYLRCHNQVALRHQPVHAIRLSQWGSEPGEEVVFVRTTGDSAEIHSHGGIAAVERILRDLRTIGARVLTTAVWSRVSSASNWEAECRQALTQCATLRTAELVLEQCQLAPGVISELDALSRESLHLRIEEMLSWADFGLHLTQPWSVVLCGRPNVGKSSLINALLGFTRSVVFDQPGTTRDVVTAVTAFDGWPLQLADTAGLRDTDGELEAAGIARAWDQVRSADLIVLVLDASTGLLPEDQNLLDEISDHRKGSIHSPLLVWNKCDVQSPAALGAISGECAPAISVSAMTGSGLDQLIEQIVKCLIPREPAPGVACPVSMKQVEWLRHVLRSGSLREATSADSPALCD